MVLLTAAILLPLNVGAAALLKLSALVANRLNQNFYFAVPFGKLARATLLGWAAGVAIFYALHIANLAFPAHDVIQILIVTFPISHLFLNAIFFFSLLRSAIIRRGSGAPVQQFSVNIWSGAMVLVPVLILLSAFGAYVAQ